MKNYTLKNIFSIICFIITGFCVSSALICIIEWDDIFYSILSGIISILYLIVGIALHRDANEDYEYCLSKQEEIKETYEQLSYMCKKYYWALDVDSLVPSLKNKKQILIWAADTAVACQVYIHDYDTKDKNPKLHNDLKLMIELSKNIIDNKKYL